jgi:hypothetical protein
VEDKVEEKEKKKGEDRKRRRRRASRMGRRRSRRFSIGKPNAIYKLSDGQWQSHVLPCLTLTPSTFRTLTVFVSLHVP